MYITNKKAGNLCNLHSGRENPSLQTAIMPFTWTGFWLFAPNNGCLLGRFLLMWSKTQASSECAGGRMPGQA